MILAPVLLSAAVVAVWAVFLATYDDSTSTAYLGAVFVSIYALVAVALIWLAAAVVRALVAGARAGKEFFAEPPPER